MSRRTQKNVGVIGLGIIGSRIADHLRRRGFHVFVWNRTPRPFPNFVGSRAEIADLCDFIQIFVSDDEALIETVEQLKRSLKAHHVVMAHCTVAPHTMRAAAEIVQRRGAQLLDVPFTGSKLAAEKGELVYYVGGDQAAFQRARPVLEASSKEIIEMGEVGHATTIKLATNVITATTVQATAEAMALVARAGLSPEKFATAMRGNASQSPTLAMKLPRMLEGDFEPHFSVKHMLKDVQIASRLARSQGLDLGATEAARAGLRREAEGGGGDLDYCSVVRGFFPEGVVLRRNAEAESLDEQQTLGGLDEPPAAAQRASDPEQVRDVEKPAEEPKGEEAAENLPGPTAADEVSKTTVETVKENGSDDLSMRASDEPLPSLIEIQEEERPAGANDITADLAMKEDAREAKITEPEPMRAAVVETAGPPAEEKPAATNGELAPRRNFFSRMFGKRDDY